MTLPEQIPSAEDMKVLAQAAELLTESETEDMLAEPIAQLAKVMTLAHNQAKTRFIYTPEHAQLVGLLVRFGRAFLAAGSELEDLKHRADEAADEALAKLEAVIFKEAASG